MSARRSAPLSSRAGSSPAVVRLYGEIDLNTGEAVRELLMDAIDAGDSVVVVDLSRVTFCDAGGLGVLIAAQHRARRRGVSLVLSNPGPQMVRLLQITGLDRNLPLMR